MATLTAGKPSNIASVINPYSEEQLANGHLMVAVQHHLTRDLMRGAGGQPTNIAVSILVQLPDRNPVQAGVELGADIGIRNALFATGDGQLLGNRMLARLAKLDTL